MGQAGRRVRRPEAGTCAKKFPNGGYEKARLPARGYGENRFEKQKSMESEDKEELIIKIPSLSYRARGAALTDDLKRKRIKGAMLT